MRYLLIFALAAIALLGCSQPHCSFIGDNVNANIFPYYSFQLNQDGSASISIIAGASIEKIEFPPQVSIDGEVYAVQSFLGFENSEDSRNLTSILLPEGLVSIGENALLGAAKLKAIYFPSSLMTLGKNSLEGSAITSIEVTSTLLPLLKDALGSSCKQLESLVVTGEGLDGIEDFAFSKYIRFDYTGPSVVWPELPELTRPGYVFYGWYLANGEKVVAGMPVDNEYLSAMPRWESLCSPNILAGTSFFVDYEYEYSMHEGFSLDVVYLGQTVLGRDKFSVSLNSSDDFKAMSWDLSTLGGMIHNVQEEDGCVFFEVPLYGTYKIGCNVGDLNNEIKNYCEIVISYRNSQEE